MKEKVSVLLAVLMILLMGVSGVIFMRYLEVNEQNRALREELLQAAEEIHRIREERPFGSPPVGFPQPDWDDLRKREIPDPRSWLVENLVSREDLIPWEGIHGGTMKIYDPSLVWFVGPRWCIAWVEDGHIGGFMLLRFQEDDGKPQWLLLDSDLSD